jgi:predicted metal-dependent HD superfamily phosphohydrolase
MTESDFEVLKEIALAELDALSPHLTYHSKAHTVDVVKQSIRIAKAEQVSEKDILVLKIAALFHDTGFLKVYVNHEVKGCEIFLEKSAGLGFSAEQQSTVQELIMATKLPQQPKTHLQRIICDADLDYLGRSDFFETGENLRKEFLHYKIAADNEEWERMQLNFLKSHQYHTKTSQQLREPVKQQNYSKLL